MPIREATPQDYNFIRSFTTEGSDPAALMGSPSIPWRFAPIHPIKVSQATLPWLLDPGNKSFMISISEVVPKRGAPPVIAAVAIWQKPWVAAGPAGDVEIATPCPPVEVVAGFTDVATVTAAKVNRRAEGDERPVRKYMHLHLLAVNLHYQVYHKDCEKWMVDWAWDKAKPHGWGLAVQASMASGYVMFSGFGFEDHGEVHRRPMAQDWEGEKIWRAMIRNPPAPKGFPRSGSVKDIGDNLKDKMKDKAKKCKMM